MKISQLLLFTFILALASTGWTLTEEHYHDQEMLLMQQHVDDMKTHMTMMQQMKVLVAVGIPVTWYPPHRSQRALLMHWAPTSSIWRETSRQDKDEQHVPWEENA